MNDLDRVPHAQDAVRGASVLIAVIDSRTGRQVVNMRPEMLAPPLIELRCAGAGFGWHDNTGQEGTRRTRTVPVGTWVKVTRRLS